MADFKIVISDPKIKKAYQIEVKSPDSDRLIGKKIGEKIKGEMVNVPGFEFQITGGSDKQGFPMRKEIRGTKRIKVLVSDGPGFKPKRKGERKRKSLRGNQISEDIAQINMKVTDWGEKELGVVLGKKEAPSKEKEEKSEAKKETNKAPKEEKEENESAKKEDKEEAKKEKEESK